jgi:hypothetical protein
MPVQASRLTASVDVQRIVQGEQLTMEVELFDEITGQALPGVDTATAVEARFVGTDGNPVTFTLADAEIALDSDAGRVRITLSAAKSATIQAGEQVSWQIKITLADGSIRIVRVIEQLDVVAPLF